MQVAAAEILERVRAAERRGDYLGAFDIARRGLDRFPGDLALAHRAILALARSGATSGARAMLTAVGVRSDELAALDARLCKDEALAARGPDRARLARAAAGRYAALFERTGSAYPAVNAATLHLLAGDHARATELAEQALAIALAARTGTDVLDDYWQSATAAEAALVLGRLELVSAKLDEARRSNRTDHAALATTRKQLALVCAARELDPRLADVLQPPAVIHYTGHMIGERFGADSEHRIATRIAAVLDELDAGYGFGALACGADIVFAEALRARGAEHHVVLPFEVDQFIRTSVARAGEGWVDRFHACLAAASSITFGTLDASTTDTDALFAYGGQLAMGLALVRAGFLGARAIQVAVWDGKPARSVAGTAADIATWRRRGLEVEVVPVDDDVAPSMQHSGEIALPPPSPMSVKAILFGDVKGYSKLRERDVPAFVETVLGAFGKVLDGCEVDVRNTWGDGLYLVLPSAGAAARCASALQAAMRGLELDALGTGMGLRLAGHVGPVFECFDAVTRQRSFFGTHVTRTARMEPVTPEGEVFVTEPFAAALALGGDDFVCEYVGDIPAAKGFGSLRMCVLKPKANA
ncbi:MAG: TRAFs-binding domain-containing protein [Kofleriaceae bacterium]